MHLDVTVSVILCLCQNLYWIQISAADYASLH